MSDNRLLDAQAANFNNNNSLLGAQALGDSIDKPLALHKAILGVNEPITIIENLITRIEGNRPEASVRDKEEKHPEPTLSFILDHDGSYVDSRVKDLIERINYLEVLLFGSVR